jgi:menaquinone-dependent protoporphyrinogen IX oxidase
LPCENPRHKQYLKRFLKKYPTADKKGKFAVIIVNPEWRYRAGDDAEKLFESKD